MTSGSRIRSLLPPDLREVRAIEAHSFASPWTEEMFLGELARGPVIRALVLEEREGQDGKGGEPGGNGPWRVRGYILAWLVEDELHINNIAIDPLHRKRGLARVLLEALLSLVVGEGARSATLEVRAGNIPAIALYTAFGFGLEGRREGYYGDGEDALILSRRL